MPRVAAILTTMKAIPLVTVILAAALPLLAQAQQETAHHRSVYAEINNATASMRKVSAVWKDDPIVFELQGWVQGTELRKIIAIVPGEDGGGHEEFYLENGKPLFVYRQYESGSIDSAKLRKKVEDRFYFKDGKMFRWIGTDKKDVPAESLDFIAESERLTSNCVHFIKAFKDSSPTPAASKAQTTQGVFLGIEEGDYAHWRLRTKDGKEQSFFILKPDASVEKVLEKPESFTGRQCKVTWRESVANLPEAGGKTKVEQILAVEWLNAAP